MYVEALKAYELAWLIFENLFYIDVVGAIWNSYI